MSFFKRHWFTLAIPVLAVTCRTYPDPMKSGGSCHVEKYKDKLISGMFFCSGLGLSLNAFQAAATRGTFLFKASLWSRSRAHLQSPRQRQSLCDGCDLRRVSPQYHWRQHRADSRRRRGHGACDSSFCDGELFRGVCDDVDVLGMTGMSPNLDANEIAWKLFTIIGVPVAAGLALQFTVPSVIARGAAYYGPAQQVLLLVLSSNTQRSHRAWMPASF